MPRSTYYYQPRPESAENLGLLRQLDQLYLTRPFYGSRKMAVELEVNRKRIQRLMHILGIEAHYPKPNLSRPAPGQQIYPYLLRGVEILRPNHVWSTDITYIPMRGGFLYLVAVMGWFSRYVLSWELSNTMETGFCLAALDAAFRFGQPEMWNSDQGSQFTSADFLAPLKKRGISISMDGRGRALDNVFIERLWRSLKYELIYPGDFATGLELFPALESYFHFYNHQRPHQALGYRTPADLFPHKAKRKRSTRREVAMGHLKISTCSSASSEISRLHRSFHSSTGQSLTRGMDILKTSMDFGVAEADSFIRAGGRRESGFIPANA